MLDRIIVLCYIVIESEVRQHDTENISSTTVQEKSGCGKMKDYKIAPESFEGVECNWLECAGGMGLAGHGFCSFRGDWSDPNCQDFITNEAYERKEHLRYMAATPWYKRVIQTVMLRLRYWVIMLNIKLRIG